MEVNIFLGDIMITLKKFAMAVMLLAGFQQVSADVCKLKVRKEVKKALIDHGEVWVDQRNGNVWKKFITGDGKIYYIIDSNRGRYITDGESRKHRSRVLDDGVVQHPNWVHIVKSSMNNFANGEVKEEYEDAIFCSDEHGKEDEVVINVDGANNRQEEAKRQFENIIKCGLISKVPQILGNVIVVNEEGEEVTQNVFNPSVFSTPFARKVEGGKFVSDSGWAMPGISAFIENGQNIASVYCAMKTAYNQGNINNEFWSVGDYCYGTQATPFFNYEHSERQLVVNHMVDGRLSVDGNIMLYQTNDLMPVGATKHGLTNGCLFIWTYGNPCTSASEDNGENCCTMWYDNIATQLGVTNVYFSKFLGNSVSLSIWAELIDCINMSISDENNLKSLKAVDNLFVLPINDIISDHKRIKTLLKILKSTYNNGQLFEPNTSGTLADYIQSINSQCGRIRNKTQQLHRAEVENGFNSTLENATNISFKYI